MAEWPVQALEYKSFLRFRVAQILDELCEGTLRPVLVNTILDRATGGMLITPEGLDDVSQADDMVKFSSAVAHLIGRSNFDAMSGQFYARFVVVNTDNSDSYLRQPHRVMELHNDGTFVQERTDYVMMMKIDEQNMEGGNSLLLAPGRLGRPAALLHATRWPAVKCASPHHRARTCVKTCSTRCSTTTPKAARPCATSTSSCSPRTSRKASG